MTARTLPRLRDRDETKVTLRERLANLRRIYFVAPNHWPKSDRHTAIGWQPDETWEKTAPNEWSKPIRSRGDE